MDMPEPNRIYLDNAATSWPKPETVHRAVDEYQRQCGAAAGRGVYRSAQIAERIVAQCRKRVAEFLGAESPQRIIFTLNGTDSLWRLWLGFFREHFAAILSLVVLLPLAFYINWRLAILLFALCLIFTILTTMVVRKTYGMQSEVEAHYSDLSARASDALGNVALVQNFVRIDAEVQGYAGATPYVRFGDAPALALAALLVALAALVARARRSR